jgi:hypothetical protein
MIGTQWKEPEHKLNKLTERLFTECYTRERYPDWVEPYNWFYGGFTYTRKKKSELVFSTPCGLLVRGNYWNGDMGYMGIHWQEENDNPVVCCPHFDLKECELNHPVLREHALRLGGGDITHCACHLVDEPYDESLSLQNAHDEVWREADRLFEVFKASKNGRACKHRSMYNRSTKTWEMHYDPMDCARAHLPCTYCDVLHTELSPQKANVYYDRKVTFTVPGEGLIPDETKVRVFKGQKMLKKPVSITLCEAILKVSTNPFVESSLQRQQKLSSILSGEKVELLNFHIERRDVRDLKQDLADIAAGIEVIHASDQVKATAAKKKEAKEKRAEQKKMRTEKKSIARWKRYISTGLTDEGQPVDDNLKDWCRKQLEKRGITIGTKENQLSLFEIGDE